MNQHEHDEPASGADDTLHADHGAPDAPATGELTSDERTMGMLCHLLALCGYVVVPFGHILGPLIIWLIRKDQSAFVNDQGKESLNFQITVTIALIVCIPLCFICIGYFLMLAITIAAIVLVIMAAVAANGGTAYRYPWTLRLIK